MVNQNEISLLLSNQFAANIVEESRRENRRICREQVICWTGQLSSQSLKPIQLKIPSVLSLDCCNGLIAFIGRGLFDEGKHDLVAIVAHFRDSVTIFIQLSLPVLS